MLTLLNHRQQGLVFVFSEYCQQLSSCIFPFQALPLSRISLCRRVANQAVRLLLQPGFTVIPRAKNSGTIKGRCEDCFKGVPFYWTCDYRMQRATSIWKWQKLNKYRPYFHALPIVMGHAVHGVLSLHWQVMWETRGFGSLWHYVTHVLLRWSTKRH